MSRPDWCPEGVWEKAVKMASEWEENPELIQHMAEDFAPALLSAKREQQAEIDRLNKVIERMQATMSSQAEQWTRSMASSKREGMEEAAALLRDHAAISNGEALDPAVPEILAFISAKAQEAAKEGG